MLRTFRAYPLFHSLPICLGLEILLYGASLKGDDGYKTFSIRIKEETVNKLDALSEQTNRSRNELINLILEYGVENAEIIE